MALKSIEYICPLIIIVIIFILKLTIDEKIDLEHFKRLLVETSTDVMSLATSFVISFIIATSSKLSTENSSAETINVFWKSLSHGIITLFVYILFLVIVILISKHFIRKYSESEKLAYILWGTILGHLISTACIFYSITLLRSLGGG